MNSQNTHLYKKYRKKVKRRLPAPLVQFFKNLSAILTLLLIAVVVFPNNLITSVENLYHEQVARFDFRVEEIKIDGSEKIEDKKLQALSGIKLGDNIMLVDILAIKNRMEKHPWIESAAVERILPSTISITLKEEQPQAVYVEDSTYYLINRHGRKLQEISASEGQDYMKVVGAGGNLYFDSVLEQLYNFQNIYKNIESIHYVAGRRWDIKLKNNLLVKFPEANIYEAAAIFEENFGKISKLYKTCVVDLRLIPDKIYLKVIN